MAEAKTIAINLPSEELSAFCQRHQVQLLALFGSAVNGTFDAESDVDVLVTFAPQARVGFLKLSRMQRELTQLLGYPVDLVPESGLKSLIRDDVLASSLVVYAA